MAKQEYWRVIFHNGIFIVVPGKLGMSGHKLYTNKLDAVIYAAKLNGSSH